jgi:hypothetical protein
MVFRESFVDLKLWKMNILNLRVNPYFIGLKNYLLWVVL